MRDLERRHEAPVGQGGVRAQREVLVAQAGDDGGPLGRGEAVGAHAVDGLEVERAGDDFGVPVDLEPDLEGLEGVDGPGGGLEVLLGGGCGGEGRDGGGGAVGGVVEAEALEAVGGRARGALVADDVPGVLERAGAVPGDARVVEDGAVGAVHHGAGHVLHEELEEGGAGGAVGGFGIWWWPADEFPGIVGGGDGVEVLAGEGEGDDGGGVEVVEDGVDEVDGHAEEEGVGLPLC